LSPNEYFVTRWYGGRVLNPETLDRVRSTFGVLDRLEPALLDQGLVLLGRKRIEIEDPGLIENVLEGR